MPAATRRSFLKLLPYLGASVLAPSVRCAPAAVPILSAIELNELALLAHAILPHETLPVTIYQTIATTLAARLETAERAAMVRDGLANLNRLTAPAGWAAATPATQQAAIAQLQDGELFTLVRGVTVEVLYRDEGVWQLIGYGGSAIEHGGYLTRGFDAIDWLPE